MSGAPLSRGVEIEASDRVEVSIDWLAVTFHGLTLNHVRSLVARLDELWLYQRGQYGYRHALVGPYGAKILYDTGREDVHVVLPGAWCSARSPSELVALVCEFTSHDVRYTRLDLAATDRGRMIDAKRVWQAVQQDELVSRARGSVHLESRGDKAGHTVYVGSTKSDRRLCVYDKDAESEGRVPGVRWELREHHDPADAVADRIAGGESLEAVWASELVAFVDFRTPSSAEPQRRKRVEWFERIVGATVRRRRTSPDRWRSGQANREWLMRQGAIQLALVVLEDGGDMRFIYELLEHGRQRLDAQTIGTNNPSTIVA
jgi:hypothetical protein